MILRILLLICCSLFISRGWSQNNSDSLLTVIRSSVTYEKKIKSYIIFGEKIGLQNFDEVIRVGNEGIQLAKTKGDVVSIGQLTRHIGEAYYFKGNYDSAAKYFYTCIAIFEKSNEKGHLAYSFNALAKLYRKTRDLTRALQNYDKAMEIFRTMNDSSGISMINNESGVVFEYAGKYDLAAERYLASLHIDERRNDAVGICYALSNLAGLYILQNKYEIAEEYLKQALTIRKAIKDSFALALNFSDLGNAYASSKDREKAKAYIDTSNFIAGKLGYSELISTNFEILGQIAEEEGNFQMALNYYKKNSGIRDSIFSIEKTKQIEELNTRYETGQKERMIEEQRNKIALQNILMVASICLVILGAFLAYTQYRRYKWRQEAKMQAGILKQQELASKAVIEAEEAERHRIAIDLHDGVGQIMSAAKMNLSAYEHNVKFTSADEKISFEKIISLIDAGCKEVRTVSHNMMPNALLKNNLASAIREFINKLDEKVLKVDLYCEGFDESINSNTETILYRVIQECVNNVIKHAHADTVDISLIKSGNEISATIEDNGKGFDVTDSLNAEGIGLKNIRTRIEYLKGTVDIESAPGKGTLVALFIPGE